MKMFEQGLWAGLVAKVGFLKTLGLGASLIGAGLMAISRPPATRKELFFQGAAALGVSLLFGGTFVNFLDAQWGWINLATASPEDKVQFVASVYGLLGAFSWGLVGGVAYLRENLSTNPLEFARKIKDLWTK